MVYSCAYFSSPDDALDAAQERLLADAPNVRRDPAGADGGLGVRVVVSFVETEVLGTARATRRAEDHGVEHLAHEPLVVEVGASDFCGQRNAPSVGQNVAFDATLRAVGRVGAREVSTFGRLHHGAVERRPLPLDASSAVVELEELGEDLGE